MASARNRLLQHWRSSTPTRLSRRWLRSMVTIFTTHYQRAATHQCRCRSRAAIWSSALPPPAYTTCTAPAASIASTTGYLPCLHCLHTCTALPYCSRRKTPWFAPTYTPLPLPAPTHPPASPVSAGGGHIALAGEWETSV
jgi:hypothetical protein